MAVGIAHIRDEPRNFGVALRCFHAAICLYAWALGADRRLAFAWDRLGYVHQNLGDDDETESCYLRSLAIQDESRMEHTTWNEVTVINLGILYRTTGRPALNRAVRAGLDPKPSHTLPGVPAVDDRASAQPHHGGDDCDD
jgi:hypothetical protein